MEEVEVEEKKAAAENSKPAEPETIPAPPGEGEGAEGSTPRGGGNAFLGIKEAIKQSKAGRANGTAGASARTLKQVSMFNAYQKKVLLVRQYIEDSNDESSSEDSDDDHWID